MHSTFESLWNERCDIIARFSQILERFLLFCERDEKKKEKSCCCHECDRILLGNVYLGWTRRLTIQRGRGGEAEGEEKTHQPFFARLCLLICQRYILQAHKAYGGFTPSPIYSKNNRHCCIAMMSGPVYRTNTSELGFVGWKLRLFECPFGFFQPLARNQSCVQ